MLAERVRSAEEAMERMKHEPAAAEKVELFSRRLEKITHHYPDVVEAIQQLIKLGETILEAEVVAIDTQTHEFLPFQELMRRRRKHGIKEAIENYLVVINIFDVLISMEKLQLLCHVSNHMVELLKRYRQRYGRTGPTKYRKENRGS
jgi:DNA ligase-1